MALEKVLSLRIVETAPCPILTRLPYSLLAGVATRFSPVLCDPALRDGSTQDVTGADVGDSFAWPFAHYSCTLRPKAVRFVHANASMELGAVLSKRLGAVPEALPSRRGDVKFALFAYNAAAHNDARPPSRWRTHMLEGPVTEASMEELVNALTAGHFQTSTIGRKEEL